MAENQFGFRITNLVFAIFSNTTKLTIHPCIFFIQYWLNTSNMQNASCVSLSGTVYFPYPRNKHDAAGKEKNP